ncbi:MAG: hypothetical protein HXY46_16060 [Syntrophaceae bacterium]|nr:hypothetical protein [Syntrophaceae bacterium]
MRKRVVSLKKLTSGILRNGSKGVIGRSRGAKVREFIERILRGEEGALLLVLDFSGAGSIDFSWADEVVAKIISRLWSGEYGEKFLVLKGLNASHIENIGVALERKRLAALATGSEGWRIVGSLNNYLTHTLEQVMKKGQITLRELSEEEGIGMNTSGTRLLNLYRKRLVARVEGSLAGKNDLPRGRQFIYQPLSV